MQGSLLRAPACMKATAFDGGELIAGVGVDRSTFRENDSGYKLAS